MLPLLPDEWPVSEEVFQREVVDVRPSGGAVPGYLKPPNVEADRGRRHALRWVRFDCVGRGMRTNSLKGHPADLTHMGQFTRHGEHDPVFGNSCITSCVAPGEVFSEEIPLTMS